MIEGILEGRRLPSTTQLYYIVMLSDDHYVLYIHNHTHTHTHTRTHIDIS